MPVSKLPHALAPQCATTHLHCILCGLDLRRMHPTRRCCPGCSSTGVFRQQRSRGESRQHGRVGSRLRR